MKHALHEVVRSAVGVGLGVGMVVTLSACSGDDDDAPAPSPTFTQSCSALVGRAVTGGTVTTAEFVAATAGTVTASSFPDHCLARGAMNARTGIDNKPYALGFELRLPVTWNSRFYYQGGSGVDGTLFVATGAYPAGGNTRNALLDGYAVVTTDSGHRAETGVANGSYLFAVDPQARLEYGDQQVPQVTAAAKQLINNFYGKAPDKSYFVGCSNGGRQAMIAAQRYPTLFDGIVAAAPGFRLTQAAVQGSVYQTQLLATIAPTGADGRPDISQSLTDTDLKSISNRILQSCDALDGATDGIVSKLSACQPDPAAWACTAGQTTDCLTPAKAAVVKQIFAGAKTSTGAQIYERWSFDPGIADAGAWRTWFLGSRSPNNALLSIFAGELSHIYTSPPTVTPDLYGYSLTANVDAEYAKTRATTPIYTVSAESFTNAESPNLDAFKARGGKLLMFNGTADPAFSFPDIEAYYRKVQARYGSDNAAESARLFAVPGMAHCSGGSYGTDQFDAFGALVKWVEQGAAPDTMTATARAAAGAPWPGRTRPLCSYPKEAIYKGTGSIESAASFECRAPS